MKYEFKNPGKSWWVEAYCTYNGINTYKKMHPILNYFAKHFSQKEK